LIFNPCISPTELLQNINREFGIPTNTSNNSNLLDSLNLFLLQQNTEGRTVVLVIDEAQNLEATVLEQIRLISNLETDREKLIQIILSGQPEFVQTLKKNEMRQLSQRINVRYHLQAMDFQDSVRYINHRLEVAGGKSKTIFSKRALKLIYKYSRGLPRLINVACDRALLAGYSRDTARINSRIAAAGIKDMRRNSASYNQKRRLILIPMFFILATLLVLSFYFKWYDLIYQFNASRYAKVTEEQAKEDPILAGEEFSRAMADELGKVTELESARRAFNTLASSWNVQPILESSNLNQLNEMEGAALNRKLRLYRFSGNLGALLRFGYPAVLELTMPGIPGKRFISLVGMENEQLLVDPPIAGRRSFSFSEVEKYWTGQGFLLWKDTLNLLTSMTPGSKGDRIKQLQDLLREAGAYSRPSTGVYDGDTISAVKEFQSSRGVDRDGIIGVQTLMLLYGSIHHFEVPRLAVERK